MGITPLVSDSPSFQVTECHVVVDKTTTDIVSFKLDNKEVISVNSEVYNSTKVGDPYCTYSFTTLSIIMMVVGFTIAGILLLAAGGGELVGAIIEGAL